MSKEIIVELTEQQDEFVENYCNTHGVTFTELIEQLINEELLTRYISKKNGWAGYSKIHLVE